MTTTTGVPASSSVLRLGYRIQQSWDTHPDIFGTYKISREAYDAAVVRAQQAQQSTREARERKKEEINRLKVIRAEQKAKADADYERAKAQLHDTVAAAVTEERAAMTHLSRLANGARYYAKGLTLSDESAENDSIGRQL